MPRVSREQTDRNRLAIEEVSARLFREQGIRSVSVADLMAAAGLTHGGFYGHFASKDALAAVACDKAFEQSEARWRERIEGQPDRREAFKAVVDGYLSRHNRDHAGEACPSATLAADVARESADKPIRTAYLAGIKRQLKTLAALQESGDARGDRRQAVAQLAMLVGAITLARATAGDGLANEFLSAAKDCLLAERAAPAAAARPRGKSRKRVS